MYHYFHLFDEEAESQKVCPNHMPNKHQSYDLDSGNQVPGSRRKVLKTILLYLSEKV